MHALINTSYEGVPINLSLWYIRLANTRLIHVCTFLVYIALGDLIVVYRLIFTAQYSPHTAKLHTVHTTGEGTTRGHTLPTVGAIPDLVAMQQSCDYSRILTTRFCPTYSVYTYVREPTLPSTAQAMHGCMAA